MLGSASDSLPDHVFEIQMRLKEVNLVCNFGFALVCLNEHLGRSVGLILVSVSANVSVCIFVHTIVGELHSDHRLLRHQRLR